MRMVNFVLPPTDLALVKKFTKEIPDIDWIKPSDVYEDMVAVLNTGYEHIWRYLAPFMDIYRRAAEEYQKVSGERYMDLVEKLFSARRDIVQFTRSDFFKQLYHDTQLTHEEKIEMILGGMQKILEGMIKKGQDSSESTPQQGSSPYQTFSNIANSMLPPQDAESEEEKKEREKSMHSSRNGERTEAESFAKKMKDEFARVIKRVVDDGKDNIFALAHNFSINLSLKDGSTYREQRVGNSFKFRKMRSFPDIRNIRLADMMLDDEEFDIRFMKKNFLIQQPTQRYEKNQLVYVLADCSGSMCFELREIFMKAMLIALGKNALATKGMMFYRWFDSGVHTMKRVQYKEDWPAFLADVLNREMSGGTNLHRALRAAASDIEKEASIADETEIVMITDGTERADCSEIKALPYKKHVLLLEAVDDSTEKDYAEAFDTTMMTKVDSMEKAMKDGLELIKVV